MDAVWVGQKLLDAVVSQRLKEAIFGSTEALQSVSWEDPEMDVWDFLQPERQAVQVAVTQHFAALCRQGRGN
jgi:hypothetical protein